MCSSDLLQSRTLVEALGRLTAAVSAESKVPTALSVLGNPAPLGGSGEVVLLRSAQEALANVRRHAHAQRSTVTVDYRGADVVVLTVADDGRGFEPAAAAEGATGGGFGLDGVRARALEIGGAATIESRPGAGTRVRVEVPR